MPKTTEKKEEIVEVEKTELAESPKWEIAASDIDIPGSTSAKSRQSMMQVSLEI